MPTEIERKFLLDDRPDWLDRCQSDRVDQGYLAVVEGEREVRIRRRGEELTLTAKVGSGERREEVEVGIGRDEFDQLWPVTDGARISKVRYLAEHEGNTVEVDVYGNGLEGMIVAEVEFDTQEDADAFEPPSWLGHEVTGERGYANESLALHGRP